MPRKTKTNYEKLKTNNETRELLFFCQGRFWFRGDLGTRERIRSLCDSKQIGSKLSNNEQRGAGRNMLHFGFATCRLTHGFNRLIDGINHLIHILNRLNCFIAWLLCQYRLVDGFIG